MHASADLDVAARRIAWGKFLNAGQTCIAPDYVLVDHEVKDELVEKLTEQVAHASTAPTRRRARASAASSTTGTSSACSGLLADGAGTVAVGGEVDAAERFVAPTDHRRARSRQPRSCRRRSSGRSCPVLGVGGPAEAKAFIAARAEAARALRVRAARRRRRRHRRRTPRSGGVCVNQTLMHLLPPTCPSAAWATAARAPTTAAPASTPSATTRACCASAPSPDLRLPLPALRPVVERLVRRIVR